MRRLLAVVTAAAAGVGLLGAPASAGPERMQLDCGGGLGVIERANGASWWGVEDGAVYTTKYLRIEDGGPGLEKHYGHVVGEVLVCVAEHDVPYVDEDGDPQLYESDWTVHLVASAP